MNIFEHFDRAVTAIERVDESGMRNIRAIAKQFKTATGYVHMDSDGICSGIAMKKYLEGYGIKTVKIIPINYGSSEFKANKPVEGTLVWMVDFAHGKPFVTIWTDHHDLQVGVGKKMSTAFAKTPSNASTISAIISPKDLFPPEDLKLIDMVDSADFAANDIHPDQVMNAAFGVDKTLDVSKNRQMMGLVVNKMLLANKGKKDFLADLAMEANPSLVSMYNTIIAIAKRNGYKTSDFVTANMQDYNDAQRGKMKGMKIDPLTLQNGETTMWGTCIVQYGGGSMFKAYDRYTPFKLYPNAQYLCIGWPMGLIQVSKNPFMKGHNPHHLGDLMFKTILAGKWETKLKSKDIGLDEIKRIFEMDIKGNVEAMGLTWQDVSVMVDKSLIKGIDFSKEGGYTGFIKSIANVKYDKLSPKQKANLAKIKINLWDIIRAQSGGHFSITNLQFLNGWGYGYVDEILKPIMKDIALEMEDKRLEP